MISIVVTEIDLTSKDYRHVRYIHFDLDAGKKFCYQSRMSFNAFFHGKHRYNHRKPGRLFTERDREDWDISNEIFKKSCKKWGTKPPRQKMVSVANLWEFYKLIGYDYTKKRFVK